MKSSRWEVKAVMAPTDTYRFLVEFPGKPGLRTFSFRRRRWESLERFLRRVERRLNELPDA